MAWCHIIEYGVEMMKAQNNTSIDSRPENDSGSEPLDQGTACDRCHLASNVSNRVMYLTGMISQLGSSSVHSSYNILSGAQLAAMEQVFFRSATSPRPCHNTLSQGHKRRPVMRLHASPTSLAHEAATKERLMSGAIARARHTCCNPCMPCTVAHKHALRPLRRVSGRGAT